MEALNSRFYYSTFFEVVYSYHCFEIILVEMVIWKTIFNTSRVLYLIHLEEVNINLNEMKKEFKD